MRNTPVTLTAIAADLRAGRLPLAAYLNHLCDRIEARDAEIQALLPEPGRRERLLREAKVLEQQYPVPGERPPLYGIPVGVKDIFHVDGFVTRAGSQLPPKIFAGSEAACVTLLRRAGALILGKTATTEFAFLAPAPTRNPRNPAHTPGGSSSGSAAAVAAGFCPLALGTQTVGSTIRPAAFCGIAGLTASRDRVALAGIMPFSPSLDQLGIFTERARDLALAVKVLCPGWRGAPPGRTGATVGVPEGPYLEQASGEGRQALEAQVSALEAAGISVKRVHTLGDIVQINRRHRALMAAEMARYHHAWFEQYRDLYRPETLAILDEGRPVSPGDEQDGRAGREALRGQLEALMAEHRLDAWVAPAAPGPAPEGITATGSGLMNLPWTHAGLPAVAIPAGTAANGLPVGLECVGRWGMDEELLGVAEAVERALGGV